MLKNVPSYFCSCIAGTLPIGFICLYSCEYYSKESKDIYCLLQGPIRVSSSIERAQSARVGYEAMSPNKVSIYLDLFTNMIKIMVNQ